MHRDVTLKIAVLHLLVITSRVKITYDTLKYYMAVGTKTLHL